MLSGAFLNLFLNLVEENCGGNGGVLIIFLYVLHITLFLGFYCTLESGTSVETSFTLVNDTFSEYVACGRSGYSILWCL